MWVRQRGGRRHDTNPKWKQETDRLIKTAERAERVGDAPCAVWVASCRNPQVPNPPSLRREFRYRRFFSSMTGQGHSNPLKLPSARSVRCLQLPPPPYLTSLFHTHTHTRTRTHTHNPDIITQCKVSEDCLTQLHPHCLLPSPYKGTSCPTSPLSP
jgi:hypothetical protein